MTKAAKVSLWVIGIIIVLGLLGRAISTDPGAPTASDDSKNKEAAIEVVKKSYQPSAQLLSWNPDFEGAIWTATPQPLCSVSDCYQVNARIDIIPNGEKKTIEAQWLVYSRNTKYQTDNAEARTLFVPAVSIPTPAVPSSIPQIVTTPMPPLTSTLTAASRTAEAITGNITFTTGDSITILNKSYPSTPVHVLQGKDVEDAAKLFSIQTPSPNSAAPRALYRIRIPATDKFLNGNTICGDAEVRWVVYLSDDANIDLWNLAFFSGDGEPNLESGANLCGTFRYQLSTR